MISIALVCLGTAAYCNSFSGPFIYDDLRSLRDNIDFGGTDNRFTTSTSRPVLWLSFKLNYLLTGKNVEAFHATNLLIHLANGLLLFAIVRRNLMRKQTWETRFQHSAVWLAAAVAAIWIVHPLTTAAVTYISQRAESFAAFFYLLCIYCLIRSADSERSKRAWSWGALGACVLGMMTKEVVASLPIMALIYDRTFLAGSFAAAMKSRRWLYIGMAATWGILAGVVIQGHGQGYTVGFGLGISIIEYARTQLGVIAHYFLLCLWPQGLVLSAVDWPIARHWYQVGIPGLLVALLVVISLIAFWKWPRVGFLLVSIFLILSPSSSIIPIVTEAEADQRMYLPLAALVCLVVVGGWRAAQLWRLTRPAIVLTCCVIIVLTTLTILRNDDYQTPLRIWTDNIEKRPDNFSAYCSYGQALSELAQSYPLGSAQQKAIAGWAVPVLRRALELSPRKYLAAAQSLSTVLELSGDREGSEHFDTQLIRQFPENSAEMHLRRGGHRLNRGDLDGARADFDAVIATQPDDLEAHYYLGIVMQMQQDISGAEAQYRRVLQLDPHYRDVEKRYSYVRSLDRDGEKNRAAGNSD
jgi:hypothetical protein